MKTLGLIVLGVMLLVVGVWRYVAMAEKEHRAHYDRVIASFNRLKSKRPTYITPEEWSYHMTWLPNIAGNCFATKRFTPTKKLGEFADKLEARVAGSVDLRTIDWIWDEAARMGEAGKTYSGMHRATGAEERQKLGFRVDPETIIPPKN